MKNFGYLLKECRHMASPNKLTQRAVADVLMKDISYISKFEVGKIYIRFSRRDLLSLVNLFRKNNVPEGKIQEFISTAETSFPDYRSLDEPFNVLQPRHSNDFRYLLQKAIDLFAQTQRRSFSDVLAEMDDQLGYGRNSQTIQGWLNESIVPNSAEVEYFAKKITAGTNLDSKWIKNLFNTAGYQVPSHLIKRPLRVFLCHAHSDATTVRDIYNRLIKSDMDAWLDKEKLLPGSDWEYEIRKAVRDANVVVVCLSKNFNQRGFRQKEVRLALDVAMEQPEGEIFIIPARLEECESLETLKKWHWVDLYETGGYEKLIQALKSRAQKVGASLE